MKLILILACLVLYVAHSQAQESCRGRPRTHNCFGLMHEGNASEACRRNSNPQMWYYSRNRGECRPMRYFGCGGNGNRYCTKQDCERRCSWGG